MHFFPIILSSSRDKICRNFGSISQTCVIDKARARVPSLCSAPLRFVRLSYLPCPPLSTQELLAGWVTGGKCWESLFRLRIANTNFMLNALSIIISIIIMTQKSTTKWRGKVWHAQRDIGLFCFAFNFNFSFRWGGGRGIRREKRSRSCPRTVEIRTTASCAPSPPSDPFPSALLLTKASFFAFFILAFFDSW